MDDGLYLRIFKNSAMLTASKVYTALVGLAYLALATRALGVHNFGVLILIHAYTAAIRDLVTLKTSQCVVRYGALCLERNSRADFQKLVKFTLLLDLGFCVLGTLVGMLAIPLVAPWFGVTPELAPLATIYCLMILFNFKNTSLGLLRLFDRFDLIALMQMLVPTLRLVGALGAFLFYQHVAAFLLVWFGAGVLQCFATVWLGGREFSRRGFGNDMNFSLQQLLRPHEGILPFIWASHINRTLHTSSVHIATLIVGALTGPASAGLFKVAQEFANALVKPALLFTETVYPEMTKIAVLRNFRRLWDVIIHSALAGAALAGAILAIVFLFGQPLLGLFFGAEYVSAYNVLMLLLIAAAVALATFALDPALHAIGRPEVSMRVRLFATLVQVAALLALVPELGLPGAGLAAIAASLVTALPLLFCCYRLIKAEPGSDLSVDDAD